MIICQALLKELQNTKKVTENLSQKLLKRSLIEEKKDLKGEGIEVGEEGKAKEENREPAINVEEKAILQEIAPKQVEKSVLIVEAKGILQEIAQNRK